MRNLAWAIPAAILCGACGGPLPSEPEAAVLSWEEFRQQAFQEPETGVWINNGDELVEDELQLRESYEKYAAFAAPPEVGTTEQPLVVNRVGGADDKWSASKAMSLTYCISRSFGARTETVAKALAAAAAEWEAVANVRFFHSASQDPTCSRTNGTVVFDVQPTNVDGQYLARAFFPSSARRNRQLLIDDTAFGSLGVWTLQGILRHELGHVLGFRHEHTRPEATRCFENNSWRSLTSYDAASVMHYPHCRGSNRGDLVLTAKDKAGAAALYPKPR